MSVCLQVGSSLLCSCLLLASLFSIGLNVDLNNLFKTLQVIYCQHVWQIRKYLHVSFVLFKWLFHTFSSCISSLYLLLLKFLWLPSVTICSCFLFFQCATVAFKEQCGLPPVATLKQCIQSLATRLQSPDGPPGATLTLKEGYPYLEPLGNLTDATRKLLNGYDTVRDAHYVGCFTVNAMRFLWWILYDRQHMMGCEVFWVLNNFLCHTVVSLTLGAVVCLGWVESVSTDWQDILLISLLWERATRVFPKKCIA